MADQIDAQKVLAIAAAIAFPPVEVIAFGFLSAIARGFLLVASPNRDRRIPISVRRAVIVRDLNGERFDSRVHHPDHIVPFSKGGDHSVKNLRILPKSQNLQKSARMPKLRELL